MANAIAMMFPMELIQITAAALESIPTIVDDNPLYLLSAPSINETEMDNWNAAIWANAFYTEMGI